MTNQEFATGYRKWWEARRPEYFHVPKPNSILILTEKVKMLNTNNCIDLTN